MYALRQSFVLFAVAALSASVFGNFPGPGDDPPKGAKKMHGLISKMTAVEGKRDELIAILLQGTKEMPGCLSYIVAKGPADATTIWVTEVWEDPASHKASSVAPGRAGGHGEGQTADRQIRSARDH